MPTFTIPARHRAGLLSINKLQEPVFKNLAAALDEAPVALNRRALADSISAKISDVSVEALNEFVDTILTLYVVRATADVSVKVFVADVIKALSDTDSDARRACE